MLKSEIKNKKQRIIQKNYGDYNFAIREIEHLAVAFRSFRYFFCFDYKYPNLILKNRILFVSLSHDN